LSQHRLSKVADISYNTVIKLESGGITNPSIRSPQKLAKVLNIGFDDLLNQDSTRVNSRDLDYKLIKPLISWG